MMVENQGTILLVDDDYDIRSFLKAILSSRGYHIVTAESSEEALAILKSVLPDIILLDITLPQMSGYELCAKLQEREETAYIPIIFVTALGESQDKTKAFAVGAADYLTKPIDEKLLFQKVQLHSRTSKRWKKLREDSIYPSDFLRFKEFLATQLKLSADKKSLLAQVRPQNLYSLGTELGISNSQIAKSVAEFLKLSYVAEIKPEDVRLGALPTPFCRSNQILVIQDPSVEDSFVLSNPFNADLIRFLKDSLGKGRPYKFSITEPGNIVPLLGYHTTTIIKPTASPMPAMPVVAMSDIEEELRKRYQLPEDQTTELSEKYNEASEPIIMLVNKIVEDAYLKRASDIHIEPWETEVIVRYRIDGSLQVANRLRPQSLIRPIVSRIKIMSKLDIAERRIPQDGRFSFKEFSQRRLDFDLRVATAPMNFGEKVVLRILDKQKSVLPLEQLGFSDHHLQLYRRNIKVPYGMILHVGPTGSGKSMTLYAAIHEIQSPQINIQTIEDPIEYTLPGINQLQVHHEIGLDFAKALRCFLRQDPNVVLVGEIRDSETAKIAVQASLTGHLLFSTLHTNDAAATATRLLEMGIEPFMLSSALIMICAQRLLRRLCPECKEAYQADSRLQKLTGITNYHESILYRAKGCVACNGLGYKGRIGVHEILVFNEEVRHALSQKGITAESIKQMAVQRNGMVTLYGDAMGKVRQGITSLEETLSKIRSDEFNSQSGVVTHRHRADGNQTLSTKTITSEVKTGAVQTRIYTVQEQAALTAQLQLDRQMAPVLSSPMEPTNGNPLGKPQHLAEEPMQQSPLANDKISPTPEPETAAPPKNAALSPATQAYSPDELKAIQQESLSVLPITEPQGVTTSSPAQTNEPPESGISRPSPPTEALSLRSILEGQADAVQQESEVPQPSQPTEVQSLQSILEGQADAVQQESEVPQPSQPTEVQSLESIMEGRLAAAQQESEIPQPSQPTEPQSLQSMLATLKASYAQHLPDKIAQIECLWYKATILGDKAATEELYRLIHSLVGSGATYGFQEISNVARLMEISLQAMLENVQSPTDTHKLGIGNSIEKLKLLVLEISSRK